MIGDKVTGVYYKTRSDGVKLYRFSVPKFMIKQDQTGIEYSEAVDVENAPYTYTETDKPIEGETSDIITRQKAEAFDHLTGGDINE